MLLLAVDTSSRRGSVALCRGNEQQFETLRVASLEGGTYSAQLMPQIGEMLTQCSLGKADLDGFVVVSGPGSFTGLRVGLSTVKALCEVLRKPLASVSALEAIAVAYGKSGETVTVLIDAGRAEAFVGEYQVGNGHADMVREYIMKGSAFPESVAGDPRSILIPDEKLAESLRSAGLQVNLVPAVQADTIARIGLRKLLAGELSDATTIDANYVRRSDAELFSPARR